MMDGTMRACVYRILESVKQFSINFFFHESYVALKRAFFAMHVQRGTWCGVWDAHAHARNTLSSS